MKRQNLILKVKSPVREIELVTAGQLPDLIYKSTVEIGLVDPEDNFHIDSLFVEIEADNLDSLKTRESEMSELVYDYFTKYPPTVVRLDDRYVYFYLEPMLEADDENQVTVQAHYLQVVVRYLRTDQLSSCGICRIDPSKYNEIIDLYISKLTEMMEVRR